MHGLPAASNPPSAGCEDHLKHTKDRPPYLARQAGRNHLPPHRFEPPNSRTSPRKAAGESLPDRHLRLAPPNPRPRNPRNAKLPMRSGGLESTTATDPPPLLASNVAIGYPLPIISARRTNKLATMRMRSADALDAPSLFMPLAYAAELACPSVGRRPAQSARRRDENTRNNARKAPPPNSETAKRRALPPTSSNIRKESLDRGCLTQRAPARECDRISPRQFMLPRGDTPDRKSATQSRDNPFRPALPARFQQHTEAPPRATFAAPIQRKPPLVPRLPLSSAGDSGRPLTARAPAGSNAVKLGGDRPSARLPLLSVAMKPGEPSSYQKPTRNHCRLIPAAVQTGSAGGGPPALVAATKDQPPPHTSRKQGLPKQHRWRDARAFFSPREAPRTRRNNDPSIISNRVKNGINVPPAARPLGTAADNPPDSKSTAEDSTRKSSMELVLSQNLNRSGSHSKSLSLRLPVNKPPPPGVDPGAQRDSEPRVLGSGISSPIPARIPALLDHQDPACSPVHGKPFQTVAMIGQGGYAVVRVIRFEPSGEVFALKQIAKSDFTSAAQLHMAFTEIEILQAREQGTLQSSLTGNTNPFRPPSAKNPREKAKSIERLVSTWGPTFFPRYFGCWQNKHFIFFLMEYLPGGDLMKHLIDCETFPEHVAKFYTAELALAIGYMHDHLHFVHRDVKPDNVLFDSRGHIRLVDFGLSRKLPVSKRVAGEAPSFTERFHHPVGTPDYMAPEVHRGVVPHDRTIDWWSLGIILYEMLFGGPPLSDVQHRPEVTSLMIKNWQSSLTSWPQTPRVSDLAKDLLNKRIDIEAVSLIAEKTCRYRTVEEVLLHPWFDSLNLADLRQGTAPIQPPTQGPCDVSNFDSFTLSCFKTGLTVGTAEKSNGAPRRCSERTQGVTDATEQSDHNQPKIANEE